MTTHTNQTLRNPLLELLELDEQEKLSRGLLYTPQEIWQQPDTWPSTFARVLSKHEELRSFLSRVFSSNPTVYLVGAGTSDYIGRCLASVLRQSWQCEVMVVPSTELVTNIENYVIPGKHYLWISFSRSGDSSEGVGALDIALRRYPHIHHLVIGCNKDGEMPRLSAGRENARVLLLDDTVNDQGLAMTSSFTNMVLAGQCIGNLDRLETFRTTVDELCRIARHTLSIGAQVANATAALQCRKACFVGTGALAGVATESALKCLELTAGRLSAMSESTMGLRHGPMSALDKDTIFVQFVSSDSRRQKYERDLLREVHEKDLGRVRIAIAPSVDDELRTWCDHVISYGADSSIPDDYRVVIYVLFGQLLGLFASLHAGLKPDAPSPDGTITRVVSHVRIYP